MVRMGIERSPKSSTTASHVFPADALTVVGWRGPGGEGGV